MAGEGGYVPVPACRAVGQSGSRLSSSSRKMSITTLIPKKQEVGNHVHASGGPQRGMSQLPVLPR